MKRKFVFFLAAVVLAACSNEETPTAPEPTDVVITFTPYDVSPMTRTATSIATLVTHLDVWITDGTTVTALHQTSDDSGFGSLSVTLDKTKTYTLYAVGHRGAEPATLTDGIITFDKITHSMYYSTTFSPATTTSLSCEMQRIVGCFRLEITDAIPSDVVKFRFTITDVYDQWSVTDGATHQLDRTSIVNYGGTSAIFNVYAIVTDAQTTHTVTVTALDENDQEIQTRTFADVPLRNGYRTAYRGQFFTNAAFTSSFTVNDWNEYETVDF